MLGTVRSSSCSTSSLTRLLGRLSESRGGGRSAASSFEEQAASDFFQRHDPSLPGSGRVRLVDWNGLERSGRRSARRICEISNRVGVGIATCEPRETLACPVSRPIVRRDPVRIAFRPVGYISCWRGGRVVDRAGFENQYTFTGIQGSNPCLSALTRVRRTKGWQIQPFRSYPCPTRPPPGTHFVHRECVAASRSIPPQVGRK